MPGGAPAWRERTDEYERWAAARVADDGILGERRVCEWYGEVECGRARLGRVDTEWCRIGSRDAESGVARRPDSVRSIDVGVRHVGGVSGWTGRRQKSAAVRDNQTADRQRVLVVFTGREPEEFRSAEECGSDWVCECYVDRVWVWQRIAQSGVEDGAELCERVVVDVGHGIDGQDVATSDVKQTFCLIHRRINLQFNFWLFSWFSACILHFSC